MLVGFTAQHLLTSKGPTAIWPLWQCALNSLVFPLQGNTVGMSYCDVLGNEATQQNVSSLQGYLADKGSRKGKW